MPLFNPLTIEVQDEGIVKGDVTKQNFVGSGVVAAVSGDTATITISGGAGGDPVYTEFIKDLGVAQRSGTFNITGLSGLTPGKFVHIAQSAAEIASKGNARDEPEMDLIKLTGYVFDATTIKAFWEAPSIVVGDYAFAYLVSA